MQEPGNIYGVFRNKIGMAKFLQLTLNEGKIDAEAREAADARGYGELPRRAW